MIDRPIITDQLIVTHLKELLKANPTWEKLLVDSITEAKTKALALGMKRAEDWPDDLPGYYYFINNGVTLIPREDYPREAFIVLATWYWLLDQAPGRELQKHKPFWEWMVSFAKNWGAFLNTTPSAAGIDSFRKDPAFGIEQYFDVGGWLTFNQFFAREIKPGLRPVTGRDDPKIICSPADSVFKEQFDITSNNEVVVKHTHTYRILDLLRDSPYQERFAGGLFMHSFLGPNDYHRFHAPVDGTVKECRKIEEKVYLDVKINSDGEFEAPDGAGYEFHQTRGLIIQESEIGLVATLPIGMAQVSSVNMVAMNGSWLNKGDMFGFFMFGGSDIIMLFEKKSRVHVTAAPTIHYNCGMGVAESRMEE